MPVLNDLPNGTLSARQTRQESTRIAPDYPAAARIAAIASP
jgi:hypothetical protein